MEFYDHLLAESTRIHSTHIRLTGVFCQYDHAHVDRSAASACTGSSPGDWIYRSSAPASPHPHRWLHVLGWIALLLITAGITVLAWWRT